MLHAGTTLKENENKILIWYEMLVLRNAKYATLTEQSSVKLSKLCPGGSNLLKPKKVKSIILRRMIYVLTSSI
jgi:hypothetical protein